MPFNDEEYTKHRLSTLKSISNALTGIVGRTIKLDNFGQKHPGAYTFTIGHTITNVVIDWEELMFIHEESQIEELAQMIKDRINESSNKNFFYTRIELQEIIKNKDIKGMTTFTQLMSEKL